MADLFQQELDSLEGRLAVLTYRAGGAADAEALSMLREAVDDLTRSLHELRTTYANDVSQRRQAEDALRRREAEHQRLLDELPCSAWRTDADGRVTYVNDYWRDYSGLNAEETGATWDAVIHPDDQPATIAAWRAARDRAEAWQNEHRLRRDDGAWRWHLTRAHPIRDARGDVVAWVATSSDIHDLKEDDLKVQRLYDEERQAAEQLTNSVETKDAFLGLMAHELKTPITTIVGNAEVLLRREEQLDHEARHLALTDIHEEASRLHRTVEDLLSLARIEGEQDFELEPILLGHVVMHVIEEQQRRDPSRIYETRLPAQEPPVLGERVYIEQVVRNLLSNAEKYSPRDLPIEVTLTLQDHDIEVAIGDHGSGLSAEEARTIFQPFVRLERTALQASGSGIGLAVCKRLIEAQSGRIWARPRPEGGSEFCFALPIADDPDDDAV
ncbi:MAG TPA: PAS domain-containing sensor histidine kinase [Dehalococcoidia bacterium]